MSVGNPIDPALVALETEIGRWSAAERMIRLFMRDDDAVRDTAQLRRLAGVCARYHIPLLLASIPKLAERSLATTIAEFPLITPAVHGFAHVSHSPPGEKTCELDHFRPITEVVEEMRRARSILEDLFGDRLSGLLVPPWNRIHDEVLPHVRDAGFKGISAHGWPDDTPVLKRVNVHVDIIHWSGGTVGRTHSWVYSELAANLAIARERGWQPVGLLTHHLVHDNQAWRVLEDLLALMHRKGASWIAADEILAEAD